jgi:hypothetical protein
VNLVASTLAGRMSGAALLVLMCDHDWSIDSSQPLTYIAPPT